MKDVSSDASLKATVAAIVVYALAMGLIGDYFSLQCGPHWFMYIVISYSLFAVPVLIVIYVLFIWLLSQYTGGHMRYWLIAGALAVVFFVGCYVFAHLQPSTPFYSGADCQPT
jgi:hypothetical protein